jgi:hypothetical protein
MHLRLKKRALCAPLLVPSTSPEALHVRRHERPLSAKGGIMGEKWPIKFSLQCDFHGNCRGFFTCHKAVTRDQRLYFPSEGRHAEDFHPEKSDGFGQV